MTVTVGLLALLEARSDKGGELAAFLKAGRALAVAEEETVTWYAFQVDDTHFGIFDTFETDHGRREHLDGEIPIALAAAAQDLLAEPPSIQPVNLIAVK
jgi:quinol monooxygenase YgiN